MYAAFFASCAVVGVLLLAWVLARVWQAGVDYGQARQVQDFKAAAMLADELHAARARRRQSHA